MYNEFLSGNDDDLFQKPSNPKPDSSSNFDSLIKELEDSLKLDKDQFYTDVNFKSKLFNALVDSTNVYINNITSFDRTTFDTLNTLTNGLYSRQLYANVLEEAIARKLLIHDFLTVFVSNKNDKIIKFLSQKMNVNIDSRFYEIYVSSMLEMLDTIINYNISMYVSLCEKINKTPIQNILDRDINDIDFAIFSSDTYINTHFSVIRSEMGFEV